MMLHAISGGYAETLIAAQLKLLGDLDYMCAASAVRAPLVSGRTNAFRRLDCWRQRVTVNVIKSA
jgi:hypothetical protein